MKTNIRNIRQLRTYLQVQRIIYLLFLMRIVASYKLRENERIGTWMKNGEDLNGTQIYADERGNSRKNVVNYFYEDKNNSKNQRQSAQICVPLKAVIGTNAYVANTGIGIQAIDLTAVTPPQETAQANAIGGTITGNSYYDVSKVKNNVVAVSRDTFSIISPQLSVISEIKGFEFPYAVTGVEDFPVDLDNDGNTGYFEDNDGDSMTSAQEAFDLAFVLTSECLEIINITNPLSPVKIDRIPGPASKIVVDRYSRVAYSSGLSIISLKDLSPLPFTGTSCTKRDSDNDGIDDRILYTLPEASGIDMVLNDNSTVAYVADYSGGVVKIVALGGITGVDLDIDSDNDNGEEDPSRSWEEDRIEDIQGDYNNPGKLVLVNDDDLDGNSVPDFADGINLFDNESGMSEVFTPIIMELHLPKDVDIEDVRIKFSYSSSDPAQITMDGDDQQGYTYTPAQGHLRLWTKDGNQSRRIESVSAETAGDYIAPDVAHPATSLGIAEGTRVIKFFVEGINVSEQVAEQEIKMEMIPYSTDPDIVFEDAVRLTVIDIDLVDMQGNEVARVPTVPYTFVNSLIEGIGEETIIYEEEDTFYAYTHPYRTEIQLSQDLSDTEVDSFAIVITDNETGTVITDTLTENDVNLLDFTDVAGTIQLKLPDTIAITDTQPDLFEAQIQVDAYPGTYYQKLVETDSDSLDFKTQYIRVLFTFSAPLSDIVADTFEVYLKNPFNPLEFRTTTLLETGLNTNTFSDGNINVQITKYDGFDAQALDSIYATVSDTTYNIFSEPVVLHETNYDSKVFGINGALIVLDENNQPTIAEYQDYEYVPPVIPEELKYRIRVKDASELATSITVNLKGFDEYSQETESYEVTLSGSPYLSEKIIVAVEGSIADEVREAFSDYIFIDPTGLEKYYKQHIKTVKSTIHMFIASRYKDSGQQWTILSDRLTNNHYLKQYEYEIINNKAVPGPKYNQYEDIVFDYDTEIELWAILRIYDKKTKTVQYMALENTGEIPNEIEIYRKDGVAQTHELKPFNSQVFQSPKQIARTIKWLEVSPKYIDRMVNDFESRPNKWQKLAYKEKEITQFSGQWKVAVTIDPQNGNVKVGTHRYAAQYGELKTPDKDSHINTYNDFAIANEATRIIIKGNYNGNVSEERKEYINWLYSYFDVPFVLGSAGLAQSERYIAIDCADLAIAAYRKLGKNDRYTDAHSLYGFAKPGAVKKYDLIYGPVTITKEADFANIPKPLPGDIILFDWPDYRWPGSFDHTTIYIGGNSTSNYISRDDMLIYAGGDGHRVDEHPISTFDDFPYRLVIIRLNY